jgi:hypothetical protein
MKYLLLWCISAACSAQSYENSTFNPVNSPYAYENSPYNYQNSVMNPDNSKFNPDARNGVYDRQGTWTGYTTQGSANNYYDASGQWKGMSPK